MIRVSCPRLQVFFDSVSGSLSLKTQVACIDRETTNSLLVSNSGGPGTVIGFGVLPNSYVTGMPTVKVAFHKLETTSGSIAKRSSGC